MINDLLDWLAKIHAADQAAAETCAAVYPTPWDVYSGTDSVARVRADGPLYRIVAELEESPANDGWASESLQHIARHDPTTVQNRIEAENRLITQYEDARSYADSVKRAFAAENSSYAAINIAASRERADALAIAVRIVGVAYATRPGYREEWRP